MTQQSHYFDIYPEKITILIHACNPVINVALFTIARTWKQPRFPLTDEWIKNLWYIYTVEYYSNIKKSKSESILVRWMKLEPAIQSKMSEIEKQVLYITVYA